MNILILLSLCLPFTSIAQDTASMETESAEFISISDLSEDSRKDLEDEVRVQTGDPDYNLKTGYIQRKFYMEAGGGLSFLVFIPYKVQGNLGLGYKGTSVGASYSNYFLAKDYSNTETRTLGAYAKYAFASKKDIGLYIKADWKKKFPGTSADNSMPTIQKYHNNDVYVEQLIGIEVGGYSLGAFNRVLGGTLEVGGNIDFDTRTGAVAWFGITVNGNLNLNFKRKNRKKRPTHVGP